MLNGGGARAQDEEELQQLEEDLRHELMSLRVAQQVCARRRRSAGHAAGVPYDEEAGLTRRGAGGRAAGTGEPDLDGPQEHREVRHRTPSRPPEAAGNPCAPQTRYNAMHRRSAWSGGVCVALTRAARCRVLTVITAKQRGEFHAKYEKAKFKPYEVRFNKCAPRPAPAPPPARRRRTRGGGGGHVCAPWLAPVT